MSPILKFCDYIMPKRLKTGRTVLPKIVMMLIQIPHGEKFYRKRQFYLISCEMGFRYEKFDGLFKIQLAKKLGSVPLTRDYMYDWERTHKQDKRLNFLVGIKQSLAQGPSFPDAMPASITPS